MNNKKNKFIKVNEIAKKIQYGYTGKIVPNGNIKYLRITDIQNGKVNWNAVPQVNINNIEIEKYILKKGDILFTRTGATAGKTYIFNEDVSSIFASYLIRISPDINIIEPEYLYFYFQTSEYWKQINKDTVGAAQPNFNGMKLSQILVPLLGDLKEQAKIVQLLKDILRHIDNAILWINENIVNTEHLMASILNDLIGNLNVGDYTINDVCLKITDGSHVTPKYLEKGIPFLSVKNITKGKIDFTNTKFISKEQHEEFYKRCNPELNDILYTKIGTTGVAKKIDVYEEFSIFVSIALLKPDNKLINSNYFEMVLNSPMCYEQSQKLTRGVANRNLVLKDLKKIKFPLPDLETQEKLFEHYSKAKIKIDLITFENNHKLSYLKSLKSSILNSAFKGEL